MKLKLVKNIYALEDIDLNNEEIISFFLNLLTTHKELYFGFKYYHITLNNINNIIDSQIRKVNLKLKELGHYVEDISEDENIRFVKENAIYFNDYWYNGYQQKMIDEDKSMWIKVENQKELIKALSINRCFVCAILNNSKSYFEPDILIRRTEDINNDGVDIESLVIEENKIGIFFNEIVPLFNIKYSN